MIIVEGTDKVGKSTLCDQLANRLKYDVQHFGLLPPDWDFFWDYARRMRVDTIWDRGWMSELAYEHACSREKRLDWDHQMMVMTALKLYGCMTVVVTCDEPVLLRRLMRERDDKFDAKVVIRANRWFDKPTTDGITDMLIRCTERSPYPTAKDVRNIIAEHTRRMTRVHKTSGRQGPCLLPASDVRMSSAATRSRFSSLSHRGAGTR